MAVMMRVWKPVLTAVLALGWPLAVLGAAEGGGHEGLPQNAVPLSGEHGFITNSMVVTWVVALGIIVFARLATRRIQAVPEGAQNFWEWMVESLYEFLEGIVGSDLVKRTFWFFASIFIFILACNWIGLIPGVGTLGWGTPDATGHLHHIETPLLRGVNADLNMTFAMAMIFFALWFYWALQSNGPGGFLLHLFGPKGETTGVLKILMVVIFALVGVLEVVTILFRPVTLSFRLYGNVFAGENMLEAMATLVQNPAWLKAIASVIIPIPFYFLEVLVGLVQALVFMLLTAVFTLLICTHEEGHEAAHH
jgi:F-type H+-transporting ATPase subunit a